MRFPRTRSDFTPYSYRFYFCLVLIIVTIGIINTLYLSFTHYQNYTNPIYNSFCAISKTINCDTVSQSPWSLFLDLPLSYWGLTGYILFLSLLYLARKPQPTRLPIWSILLLISTIFSIISIVLGYISYTKIGSYCILCIFSYTINFTLLFSCWITKRRIDTHFFLQDIRLFFVMSIQQRATIVSLLLPFILIAGLKIWVPKYWQYPHDLDYSALHTGITREGNPWIGAENAELTIEIFSDYMCFQCAKMNQALITLIRKKPDKIKLIHHHYPLDHHYNNVLVKEPFHEGSGQMALLAIYAMTEGKFWQMSDILFELGRHKQDFNIRSLAKKIDIDPGNLIWAINHEDFKKLLARDIRIGLKHRITGTPSFVIDGKVYNGIVPPRINSMLQNE